jgi:hypothetical protein
MGWRNIFGGVVSSVIVTAIVYLCGYLNRIPKIDFIYEDVETIKKEVIDIKNQYLSKDTDGIDIMVGVSGEASDQLVIIFSDNTANLRYGDPIELYYSVGDFSPKLKLLVSKERDRNGDKSLADIFISKDAAKAIGFKDYQKTGIVKMKARKLKQTE